MTKLIRALMLPLALMIAAPAFADKNKDDMNVDCSKIEGDDARKKCHEKKHDMKNDDKKVDCSKINGDDARKKCREMKHNN